MPRRAPVEYKTLGLNLEPAAYKAIKILAAMDFDVPPGRLIRDIVSLYLGYRVGNDPRFSAANLGAELPGIVDEPKGYVRSMDFFRAPAKTMPDTTPV